MSAVVDFPAREMLEDLRKNSDRVFAALNEALVDIGTEITNRAIGGAPISTGELRRNIAFKVKFSGDSGWVEAGVGVGNTKPLIYAQIQDVGGVIRPKKAQKLAIPVSERLKTASGVGGITARDVISRPEEFGFKSTFTTATAILGKKADGSVEVLFARKSSVKIPGTGYLSRPSMDMESGGAARIIKERLKEAARK
jgi:hypothetical protein